MCFTGKNEALKASMQCPCSSNLQIYPLSEESDSCLHVVRAQFFILAVMNIVIFPVQIPQLGARFLLLSGLWLVGGSYILMRYITLSIISHTVRIIREICVFECHKVHSKKNWLI